MVVTVVGARTSRLVYLRLQMIIVGKARGKNGLKHEMRISSPFGRGSCSHRHCCRTCRCGCRCPLSNLWWFRVDVQVDACYYNTLHARAVLHHTHKRLPEFSTTFSYLSFFLTTNTWFSMPQRTTSPWTSITSTFICISMFSLNINIRIHSFFDAKRFIGRNSVDAEAQSDFKVFSNPRFVWNLEERKKNSYVVSFFRLFLVLTSFISSHPKKSLEWFSRWRKLRNLNNAVVTLFSYFNDS